MEPDHRAAHEMKNALGSDDRRASAWLPVLQPWRLHGAPSSPRPGSSMAGAFRVRSAMPSEP
jgi:hypothetical protein